MCEKGGSQVIWNDLIAELCMIELYLNPPLPMGYGALIVLEHTGRC